MKSYFDLESRKELIEVLSERDGYFCFLCKGSFGTDEKPTIDHFYPLSKGGTWDLDNLKLSHSLCNAKKGNIVPNPDGTIPPREKDLKVKVVRPDLCEHCHNGRALLSGEVCDLCGSVPQPLVLPKYLQRHPRDCDHSRYYCWNCHVYDPTLREVKYV
jgi:hypothetical protein